MGGLLFPGQTRRYLKDEYFEVTDRIYRKLSNLEDGFRGNIAVIPAARFKDSYGDNDIIVEILPGENPREIIERLFKPEKLVHNGNTYSFVFEEIQTDIIITNPEDYYFHLNFLSFSNLGMLMGCVSRSVGLKYAHDGLWYKVRDGAQMHGALLITKDSRTAFDILGFNFDKFLCGFDTDKEVFDYVVNSKYFNPPQFELLNLNSARRERNKKRQGWHDFISYISGLDRYFNENGYLEGKKIVKEFLEHNYFIKRGEEIIKKAHDLAAAKKKMIQIFAADYPQIQNKALGESIVKFKKLFTDDKEYVDFLLNSDNITISEKIKNALE